MRIRAIAFTKEGLSTAANLADALTKQGNEVCLYAPERLAAGTDLPAVSDLRAWSAEAFAQADALLFVSATGIATRAIAPFVDNKYKDPAVVCVDEGGRFAVPLLSGHVGGANELARTVSRSCGAQAVVSTATDMRGLFAVDEWAASQGLWIVEHEEAKRVSATLLDGGRVGFVSEVCVKGELPQGLVSGDAAGSCDTGIVVSYALGESPFPHTLHLVPRSVVVGVGCKRGTSAVTILRLVDSCLEKRRIAPEAVRAVASIDVKRDEDGLCAAARERGWDLLFYSADELASVPGEFSSSEFVQKTVGVGNVCERAACAGGAKLMVGKQSSDGVSVALSTHDVRISFPSPSDSALGMPCPGEVVCVGIGPGGADDMTLRAHKVLQRAQVIVGYTTYVGLVRDSYPHAEFVTTGMRGEERRCRIALERAMAGERVAVICSGDPGIYGMASLLLELAEEYPGVEVRVVPGVSAANGGAAVLGAPIAHDWCAISLSDLMTPWETIERRLRAAASADLCICLYNPSSHGRADYLRRACDVLLEYARADTVCGVVRNIGRAGEKSRVLTLGRLRETQVDMLTCVFVGNSQTRIIGEKMVTPRGYTLASRPQLGAASSLKKTGEE